MEKQVDFGTKRTEQELSSIGAKVADATDYAQEIERLTEKQEEKLEAAQEQLSDLYESLGETPVKVAAKPEKKAAGKESPHDGTRG